MTSVTCVTSRYLPNLQHIALLWTVDVFVVLDQAIMPRRDKDSFVNRNRIQNRSSGLEQWLTVPILYNSGQSVAETRINPREKRWRKKHTDAIAVSYPWHHKVAPGLLDEMKTTLDGHGGQLLSVNSDMLQLVLNTLGSRSKVPLLQGEIVGSHTPDHRLQIARELGAARYVAGTAEWDLMQSNGDMDRFERHGISVVPGPRISTDVVDSDVASRYSVMHALCTLGSVPTRSLLDEQLGSGEPNEWR